MLVRGLNLSLKTPAAELISLEDAKRELNVLHDLKDAEINGMIEAASAQINGYHTLTHKCFGEQEWELEAHLWDRQEFQLESVRAVTKISQWDPINLQWVLVDPSKYKAAPRSGLLEIYFPGGVAGEALHLIEFTAGEEIIPALAKTAVKLRVRQLFMGAPDDTTEKTWLRCVEDLSARGC